MNQKKKLIITVAALALLLLAAGVIYTALSSRYAPEALPESTPAASGTEKMAAPDFTVYDADGNEKKLSDYFGKPIVLNFWASWCPPCKNEMPHFEKLYGEVGEDITFLMVDSVDGQRETVETGKAFIESSGYTFPVLYDSDMDAAYTYGVSSLPTTYFIDKDGYLVTRGKGQLDEETLRRGIAMIEP